jgi:hypothetical protein
MYAGARAHAAFASSRAEPASPSFSDISERLARHIAASTFGNFRSDSPKKEVMIPTHTVGRGRTAREKR